LLALTFKLTLIVRPMTLTPGNPGPPKLLLVIESVMPFWSSPKRTAENSINTPLAPVPNSLETFAGANTPSRLARVI